MYQRDYRDIIAGSVLVLLGLFAAVYASQNYAIGTARHMGPGWFPVALGITLLILGAIITITAFFRTGTLDKFETKSFITVLSAVFAFAFSIRTLGLVPAVVLLICIAAAADDRYTVKLAAIMSASMAALAVLVFIYGLGMPMQIVNWRFFG